MEVHEGTAAKMRQHYDARGLELNSARLRMATLPATAEVKPPLRDCRHVMCHMCLEAKGKT